MALRCLILTIASYACGVCAFQKPPQAPAASHSPLPSVHKMLNRPRHVLQTMSSHVQKLTAHLAELQAQNTEEVSNQKAQYEEKLWLQQDESEGTERHNAAIRLHVEHLREDSAKVRAKTVSLVQASRGLTEKVSGIRENFTEASVVITSVLEQAQEKMRSSPKLQVLQELQEKDALQKQELDHQGRLAEIGEPLALLQIDSEPVEASSKSQKDAQELVQSLMSSLGSLTEEQTVSSASLKANFESEWEAGVKRQSVFLEEQVQLNATEVREQNVNNRLHTAFQHATEAHSHLHDRLGTLHRFAKKVGSRPMPEAPKDQYQKDKRTLKGLV